MANYESLKLNYKIIIIVTLISFASFLLPHKTVAAPDVPKSRAMYFVINGHFIYLENLNQKIAKNYERNKITDDLKRQLKLAEKVKKYLADRKSPMADYSSTLIRQDNWKKIVALANAESGLCKHYPEQKANCWGVGGSNLWYMGSSLGEGIVSMNHFLNTYPRNSNVKYSQMTFKQMNGLYKQPPGNHWVYNNQVIFEDLEKIEKSL